MSSIYLKISSLLIRTLSKPIANRIKQQAAEHEGFRRVCISFAQSVHRMDMRLRLGLLQDQAAIDRQIAREAAEAKAKKSKLDIPTAKTEAQTKADDAAEAVAAKEKHDVIEKERKRPKPKIRPLSEAKAIDSGANFISEGFLFTVGLGLIVFETWRSRRKENSRRSDIADQLADLEEKNRRMAEKVEVMDHQLAEIQTKGTASSLWQKWHPTNKKPSDAASAQTDAQQASPAHKKPTVLTKDEDRAASKSATA